jgi:hypothetical protein
MRGEASGVIERRGKRMMGLEARPGSDAAGGAGNAPIWERDEGMLLWAQASGRMAEGVLTEARRPLSRRSGGQRLVEHELWDRLGLDGIEVRALIEKEVSLGWSACGRDRGRSVGHTRCSRMAKTTGGLSNSTIHYTVMRYTFTR